MDERIIIAVVMAGVLIAVFIRMYVVNRGEFAKKKAVCINDDYRKIAGRAFENNKRNEGLLIKAAVHWGYFEVDKALAVLEKLLKRCESKDDFAAVYTYSALCHTNRGHTALAVEAYEKAILNKPGLDILYNNLGLVHQSRGDLNRAIQSFEKAVEVNPENCFAYDNLGVMHLMSLNMDKAIEYSLEAIKIAPFMSAPMTTLAVAYLSKNDKENAKKYFERSVLNGENPENLKRMMNDIYAGDITGLRDLV